MREVEAKFVTSDPGVFEQILAQRRLGGYELRLRERQLLVTDYFDTDQWHLLRAKSALRVRRKGRSATISMKTLLKRSGAIETREEVEEPLPDGPPSRIELLECPLMNKVRRITGGRPLLLVLTVENNRTLIDLVRGGEKRFEMVLDDVEFVGAWEQRRHYEIEIECCSGDQYELEAFIGMLGAGFPLEPSNLSKFERGLRLTRNWPVNLNW